MGHLILGAALALLPQENLGRLLEQLDDESFDVRADAEARLKALGPKALPGLKRSFHPRAGEIAAAIEWTPFVPLWAEAQDPSLPERLGSPQAYAEVCRLGGQTPWLNIKALKDGSPSLQALVLKGFSAQAHFSAELSAALEAAASIRLKDDEASGLAQALALSAKPGHAPALRRLAAGSDVVARALGRIGLAALGDPEGREGALEELRGRSWAAQAAARAFGRSPHPPAGPLLRGLLARGDSETLVVTLEALAAYPEVDLRQELTGLLSYEHKESWMRDAVLQEVFGLLADRKIDVSGRLWEMIDKGAFQPRMNLRGEHADELLVALGRAILVADDPKTLDRIDELQRPKWEHYYAFLAALSRGEAPPKVAARLEALASGKEKASESLVELAKGYASGRRKPVPSPELPRFSTIPELLGLLEKEANLDALQALFWKVPAVEGLAPSDRERLLALCRKWIRVEGHPLRDLAASALHDAKIEEGTEFLLARAARDPRYLSRCADDPRAQARLVERLRSPREQERVDAAWALARQRHEAAPPAILEMFRRRQYVVSGHSLGHYLMNYPDRDFTEDLLPLLKDEPPPAHVEQILAYLRWRGRKDQAPLMRSYVPHREHMVWKEAVRALQEWRDRESFGVLADAFAAASDDTRLLATMRALAWVDPVRARPLLLGALQDRNADRRAAAYAALGKLAGPEDAPLVLRILQTENSWRRYPLLEAAGRIGCREAKEILLALAEAGDLWASRGLAYLGERSAVPLLIQQGDVQALDYIVHREAYAALSRQADLGPRSGYFEVPFEQARERIRKAFGADLAPSPLLGLPRMDFGEERETLLDWLERNCHANVSGGRFAHLWRNGRIELVPVAEARDSWAAWWKEHAREFAE